MSAPYLRLTDIVKDFGPFRAIDRVSLEIEAGEFVCFLGPSGCGKTTLLRVVAGLDPQNTGRVEIAGRDVSLLPPSGRDYGIVFQSYALFPNLTVAENVGYGLRSGDRRAKRERVAMLLDMVGLPEVGAKYPGQLSGGQQQRVALARALAPAPKLLLLDEPLSALDARVRLHLRAQIKDIHARLGVTTIMVTHDQEEALTMADRIVVMNRGRIEQVGTPSDIYAQPASRFVADFVGTMNFLPAVVSGEGRVRLGARELEVTADHPAGTDVTVCLRPEDVVVRDPGGANVVESRIERLEFLGAFHRASLSAPDFGGLGFSADISANLVRDLALECGMTLAVGLPSERLRLFPVMP